MSREHLAPWLREIIEAPPNRAAVRHEAPPGRPLYPCVRCDEPIPGLPVCDSPSCDTGVCPTCQRYGEQVFCDRHAAQYKRGRAA